MVQENEAAETNDGDDDGNEPIISISRIDLIQLCQRSRMFSYLTNRYIT